MSTLITEKKIYRSKTGDFSGKSSDLEKKRPKGNWKQRLVERRFSIDGKPLQKKKKTKRKKIFKKSLFYIFFLKKILGKQKQKISYLNLKLLKVFLTKYSKIKPRRKTRIKVQEQRNISKAIRRARTEGLLPFTVQVTVKRPIKKKKNFSQKNKFSKISKKK
jgi:small subunit ribosomal protein S18